MTDLNKQLEDKKKELFNNLNCPYCNKPLFEYSGNGKRLRCLNKKCKRKIKDFPEDEVEVVKIKAEIAILEQAIAEMKKQRQEEIKFLKDESDREIKKIGKPSDWIIKRIIELEDKQQLNQPKTEE